jgi:hypothetical protein
MLELQDATDSSRVADWVELELSVGEPSFSKSKVSSVVRDATGVDASDAFASDVWQYLRTRIALHSSPFFHIEGDLATRNDEVILGRLEYEVCLFFSVYGASVRAGADPKLFERMAAEAIGRHLGGPVFVLAGRCFPTFKPQ